MRMYGTAHRAKSKLDLESQKHLRALKYPRRYQFKSYRQYALAKRIWRKERRSEPYEYQHEN